MLTRKMVYWPLLLTLLLSACGGGDGFNLGNPDGSTDTTTDDTTDTTGDDGGDGGDDVTTDSDVVFSSFVARNLTNNNIAFAGTAELEVTLTDLLGGVPSPSPTVTFSSTCVSNGQATFSSTNVVASEDTGTVRTDYTAITCNGSDVITAEVIDSAISETLTLTYSGFGLGTGTGTGFTSGAMETTLAADEEVLQGGTTTITVNLVDLADNSLLTATQPAVSFESGNCDGLVTFDNQTNVGGVVTVDYNLPATCLVDQDTVTASITEGATANVDIPIAGVVLGFRDAGTGVFTSGDIGVAIADGAQLAFGGQAQLTVDIANEDDTFSSLNPAITFDISLTSTCVEEGESEITSPTNSNGRFNATYFGQVTDEFGATSKCDNGTDVVTASLTDIPAITATTSISIAPQEIGSISFVSTDAELIALEGVSSTAIPAQALVTFALVDPEGDPVPNRSLDFEISGVAGGANLLQSSSLTNANGRASVTLRGGSTNTSVSVIASILDDDDPLNTFLISTSSTPIAIGGGLPDQNSFDVAMQFLNPRGFDFSGTEVDVTVFAGDAFENRAPDGTTVTFDTNAGSIAPSCVLSDGQCTVVWRSQNPRPLNIDVDGDGIYDEADGDLRGIGAIVARTTGEESFVDLNGNGLFDATSDTVFETITDVLDEAHLETNLQDGYQAPGDPGANGGDLRFYDFNGNFTYDQAPTAPASNVKYRGIHCTAEARDTYGHCQELVEVRDTVFFCMSTDATNVSFDEVSLTPTSTTIDTVNVTFTDANGLTPAVGSTITVEATNGTIVAGESISVPNECVIGGFTTQVQVIGDVDPSVGALRITVTQPDGTIQASVDLPIID